MAGHFDLWKAVLLIKEKHAYGTRLCVCAAHEKCAICVRYFLFRQIIAWNL